MARIEKAILIALVLSAAATAWIFCASAIINCVAGDFLRGVGNLPAALLSAWYARHTWGLRNE